MAYSLIPRHDHALATRVRRQLIGLMSYLMFLLPLLYAVNSGWLGFGYGGLAVFCLVAVLINAAFYGLIRSGHSKRFEDPSLALPQVAIAGILALVIGYYSREARVLPVALLFTSFFFGVFSFSRRQYLGLTGAAIAGYALMLGLKYPAGLRGGDSFRLDLLSLLVLAIVLLWMSLLGSYIALLRNSLAKKKNALAAALSRLTELASRDELTGLHNRRHLMEVLEQQKDRVDRHGEAFAVCILDLDHFKQVNDTHGHGVGDEMLRGFSERIRTHLRRMDIVGRSDVDSTFGRYGGEEFLVVLPYAAAESAANCIRRLRAATNDLAFATSIGPLPLHFSAGIAQYRKDESIVAMLNRADEALYRAKSSGRDRVEIAPPTQ